MPSTEKKEGPVSAGVIARYTLVILAIIVTALFFWQIKEALLFAFAGIILAVILTGFASNLQKLVPISRNWSLVAVGGIIILIFGLFGFIFGSQIVDEFEEFTKKLPDQISQLREKISQSPLGELLLNGEGGGQEGNGGENDGDDTNNEENDKKSALPADTGGILSTIGITLLDVISTFLLIVVTGVYFAINPEIYKKSITLLFTKQRAERVNEAIETAGNALWQWLRGQFVSMLFVGVMTTIGLMIIGIPLALILGFMAGLADFVPIIGPWAAFLPAAILAITIGPEALIYTTLLYLVVQQLEGNVVTPLIQRRMVKIAPAYLLLSLVAFGLVFGVIGVILAAPIAVVCMVFIGMFYVEDVLGKKTTVPGRDDNSPA